MITTDSPRLLVLTVDYEIFGNGSGDVRRHITEPAERMARLCERYNVPLTVFVETEELVAFRCHDAILSRSLGYSPADLINKQVASFASRGHDIQLHLHPQWVDARYDNGRWLLRGDKGTVDSLYGSVEETEQYIADRKAVLENVTGRRVVAYRAGAFSAQPGRKLLMALKANEIVIDSSVVKGLVCRAKHVSFDYRSAPLHKSVWRIAQDVALEDKNGRIWEVPIHSVQRRRFQQATWKRLRAKFSRHVPKEQQIRMIEQLGLQRNAWQLLKLFGKRVPIKLDFHNLSPRTLLRWIKSAPDASPSSPDVLVLIGHTKEHIDDVSFEEFLRLISSEARLRVVTLDTIARQLASLVPREEIEA